jgi:hypothetical protein
MIPRIFIPISVASRYYLIKDPTANGHECIKEFSLIFLPNNFGYSCLFVVTARFLESCRARLPRLRHEALPWLGLTEWV